MNREFLKNPEIPDDAIGRSMAKYGKFLQAAKHCIVYSGACFIGDMSLRWHVFPFFVRIRCSDG